MAKFPEIGKRGSNGDTTKSTLFGDSGVAEQDTRKKDDRKPRVVLTEGAIFPRDWIIKSATTPTDAEGDGHHHMCSIGDTVSMTDAEFDAHQAAGVCVVDQEEREAA